MASRSTARTRPTEPSFKPPFAHSRCDEDARAQQVAIKRVQWVRKKDCSVWSYRTALDLDTSMDACIKKNEEYVTAFDKDTGVL